MISSSVFDDSLKYFKDEDIEGHKEKLLPVDI